MGPMRRRVAIGAGFVWTLGFVLWVAAPLLGDQSGWFNYAPNAEAVFSPDGMLAKVWIGELLMSVALVTTALTLLLPAGRLFALLRGEPSARWTGSRVLDRVLALGQVLVLTLAVVFAIQSLRLLVTQPGAWGLI